MTRQINDFQTIYETEWNEYQTIQAQWCFFDRQVFDKLMQSMGVPYHMMTDHIPDNPEQAFLRAVVEDPFDLETRLVFADWLEENRKDTRAYFIRAQIKLHELQLRFERSISGQPFADENELRSKIQVLKQYCQDLAKLSHILHLVGIDPKETWFITQNLPNQLPNVSWSWTDTASNIQCGFVESFRGTWNTFLNEGWKLVQKQPITEIHISDAVPAEVEAPDLMTGVLSLQEIQENIQIQSTGCWVWRRDQLETRDYGSNIPEEIWWEITQLGKGRPIGHYLYFETEILARQALSHACVNWSRLKCGMKRLEWKS